MSCKHDYIGWHRESSCYVCESCDEEFILEPEKTEKK